MDRHDLDSSLIRLVHGARERVQSSRYFWDNRARGGSGGCCVLQLTVRGRAFFEEGGKVSEVSEGHAMLYVHGEESSYGFLGDSGDAYDLEWLGFSGGPASSLVSAARGRFGSVVRMLQASDLYSGFQCALRFAESGSGDRFLRSSVLYGMLLSLFRQPEQQGEERQVEERAFEIMQNEFASRSNVKEIAGRLGCSREHLSRRFRERYGLAPATALRELRMERARELLRATALSVAEVAGRCGMPDHNAFHAAFRRRFGMSPRECRLGS